MIPVGEEREEERDAVDLLELFRKVRNNRRLVYKITSVFLVLGLFVALFSSIEYESEALLMPEMQESGGDASSLLQNYGGLLGLSGMGSFNLSEEGSITPQVYPKIVNSFSFQDQLLHQPIYFSAYDTTFTGYEYFKNVHSLTLGELITEYTLQLPGKIFGSKSLASLPDWLRDEFNQDAVIQLTDEELEIIEEMQERIQIELDAETGVLTVSAQMPDAVAAAQICRKVINMLKDYLKAYSTQKAKEDLEFAKVQHGQAQQRFKEAQDSLADFLDQNVNLSTAKAQTQEQRLQAEFDLAYNMYNSVSQRLMEAKMKVQEQTPVFKVLQSVNVPIEKSEPQRILILILSLFSGLIASFLYLAGRDIYHNVQSKL